MSKSITTPQKPPAPLGDRIRHWVWDLDASLSLLALIADQELRDPEVNTIWLNRMMLKLARKRVSRIMNEIEENGGASWEA